MLYYSHKWAARLLTLTCGAGLVLLFTARSRSQVVSVRPDWPMMGHSLDNSRNQTLEREIGSANVATLEMKWQFTTGGDVSATPTVAGDAVYFPDWVGNLFAINRDTGFQIWSRRISDFDGFPGSVSRVSPAIHGGDLIVGDTKSVDRAHSGGANLIAINRETGLLRWITEVEPHHAAMITGSPVIWKDTVYVGISSSEETLAVQPDYPCCSFRGSVVALNANNGEILWQTYVMPDNHGRSDGYSGGAIWQPPAIDAARGLLYVGTGNNYEVPDDVKACVQASGSNSPEKCFAQEDHFDSALALDLQTGQIRWARRLQGLDVWTVACNRNPTQVSCPLPSSPDYDLGGSGPNLLPNMVGFGQKSGIYWALHPDTGEILWSTVVGPGGTLGGIEWGTATDGRKIYVAITNNAHKPYPLTDGSTITWGAWSALDVTTGKVLWQTADPDKALAMGSVSVANGVLYAPSFSGNMLALDTGTGKILWTFSSGGSVLDGPSVADGAIYWGSGYKKVSSGRTNNRVFAFALPR